MHVESSLTVIEVSGFVSLQSPVQSTKIETSSGSASRFTVVPGGSIISVLSSGQSILAGSFVTVQVPLPWIITSSLGSSSNSAIQLMSIFIVRFKTGVVGSPVQASSPLQPTKYEPGPGSL